MSTNMLKPSKRFSDIMSELPVLTTSRSWIRLALKLNSDNNIGLPEENIARARYYLAQILKSQDTSSDEANELEMTAKKSLMRLLRLDASGTMNRYLGEEDWPMLFDYIVTWECRLLTPRKESEAIELKGRVARGNSS